PEHAPYDRIIATCSVPAIPWSWVQQTSEDGLILADVKIGKQAGNLVLLQKRGQQAEGRFDPTYGSFMGMRRDGDTYERARPASTSQGRDSAHERTTTLDLTRPWEHTSFWFFAHTGLPHGTSFSLRGDGPEQPPRNTVLHAPDGSWCEVREDSDNGTRQVWEFGPQSLWQIIEDTHAAWVHQGKPGWERFGLTATFDHQLIWLDTPDCRLTTLC
ncbi:MAG: protein-L-isoaspartate(D-aspartate) O-methyltransferase, partial [Pseudonocardiaceae bacterium]